PWNSSRFRAVGSCRRGPPMSCWRSGPTPRRPRRSPVTDSRCGSAGWGFIFCLVAVARPSRNDSWGGAPSPKKKNLSFVRPVIAELNRKFGVSAAETGSQELHRRAGIGVAMASADRRHAVDVLDAAERLVAAHPEFELLSVRRDLRHSDD